MKRKFVVVENAGRDNEYVRPQEFKSIGDAEDFIVRKYGKTRSGAEWVHVDIMLKLPDGTLTTEF